MDSVGTTVMDKRRLAIFTLAIGVRLDPLGRRLVAVDAVLRLHLDGVVANGRRALLPFLMISSQIDCRCSSVRMVLRLDDTRQPVRTLSEAVPFAHPRHRRRLVHLMHMSRRLAGSVVRRPFERTRVRHRDADGRRRRIAQHDLLLLLVLAVDVDTIDVVAARGRLAAGGIVADIGRRTASPARRTLLARTGRVAGISAFRPPAAAGAILVVAPLQRGRHAPPHLMTLRAHSDGSRPASMTPAGQAVDTSRPAVIVGQFLLVRLVGDARVMRMVRLLIVVVVLRQASVDAARPLAEHEPGIGRHVSFQIDHVIHVA